MDKTLENISHIELEELIKDLFSKKGYSLASPKATGDRGIDLWQGYSPETGRKVICEIKKIKNADLSALRMIAEQIQPMFNLQQPDEFLLVILTNLSNEHKKNFVKLLGPYLQEKLTIFTIEDIENLLLIHPDVKDKYFPKKWHEYYSLISRELQNHYSNWNLAKEESSPGFSLIRKLINVSGFVEENNWIQKLAEHSLGVDPIHIFSSISGSNLKADRRVRRINLIFKGLGINKEISNVDFAGCPIPVVIQLISTRNIVAQNEIWQLFYEAGTADTYPSKSLFDKYDTWKGIDFTSLTIFLFWSFSSKYISLDKRTTSYLENKNISISNRDYSSYFDLIKALEVYNYDKHPDFGSKGIFREVVYIAYDILVLNNINSVLSTELSKFFEMKSVSYDQATEPEQLYDTNSEKGNNQEREVNKNLISKSKLGFRIVGLEITETCGKDIFGVLKDKIFTFDNCFKIKKNTIEYSERKDLSLYTLNQEKYNRLEVNISALVGKNGSGKSTITEIIFSIINNLSFKFRKQLNKNDLAFRENVAADLYWISSDCLYCLKAEGMSFKIKRFTFKGKMFKSESDFKEFKFNQFMEFFYTIAINYSIYSLNSLHINDWIEKLFHKNDGYQTPVVINPMRIKGNIDINKEDSLVRYRLMANLLQPIEIGVDIGIRQLTKSQKAEKIRFTHIKDKNKFLYLIEDENGHLIKKEFSALTEKHLNIINIVKEIFEIEHYESSFITIEAEKYIIKKIISISRLLPKDETVYDFKTDDFKNESKLRKFLTEMRDEHTHLGFKLKQAINYLKYPGLWGRDSDFELSIEKASDKIEAACIDLKEGTYDFNDFLPPPIFDPFIVTITEDKSLIPFEKMSSGEKQLIYSINSILYHVKNIQSIYTTRKDKLRYKSIFLLLDEIELYYHPDLQRKYLSYLLKMLEKMDLSDQINGISILLVTHSPFILSDIPNQYLLRLTEGFVKPYNETEKTFGANIYDLLANDFFMDEGFIGEIAMQQIKEIVDYIVAKTYIEDKHIEFKRIVDVIGDEAVKFKLNQQLSKLYIESDSYSLDDLEYQKREIEEKIKKIKNQ